MHRNKKLSKNQQKKLKRRKKPKLLDSKSPNINNEVLSPPPKCEALPNQLTLIPCPPSQDHQHKRDYEDDIQIEQPANKQPRQLSPSQNISSNLEPQQPQSPTPINEDFDPSPTFTNDGKRQYQQDGTRNNKKNKHQENVILLTITETPLPQLITLSDPVPTSTDPLLETLAIPSPPQLAPQSQVTESTINETTVNYPYQEQTTTRTRGFKHHSLPMIDPPSESPSQEFVTSTSSFKPHTTTDPSPASPNQAFNTTESEMSKPPNWNTYTSSQKANWRKRHKNLPHK